MEYRSRKDEFGLKSESQMTYEDNVILWYDAISDKIEKIREQKFQVNTFYKEGSMIGVSPIIEDSESLLNRLDNKKLYLPFIEKMTENRRREWLSVRLILKELMGTEKEILYNDSGRPYLSDNSYLISISHTKGYAAVILNKKREVAIDIEKISSKVEKVWSHFVNEEEEKSLSKENRLIHLLLHWSAKESIFKFLNTDAVDFKQHLLIAPFEPVRREWDRFRASETRTEAHNSLLINYFVHEDYVLTFID
jgi:4'-phosphopantetheinyl transferase EntD